MSKFLSEDPRLLSDTVETLSPRRSSAGNLCTVVLHSSRRLSKTTNVVRVTSPSSVI